jgi:hypothetical protein
VTTAERDDQATLIQKHHRHSSAAYPHFQHIRLMVANMIGQLTSKDVTHELSDRLILFLVACINHL